MIFLKILPTILTMIITAAHFFRAGKYILVAISLSILITLFFKYRLSLYIIRITLILSTAMWLNTAIKLINIYIRMNHDWHKVAYILGGVILFNIFAFMIMFFSKSIEKRYSKTFKS